MEIAENKVVKFKIEGGEGITPASFGKELIGLLEDLFVLTEAYSPEPIGITAVENNCITVKFLVPIAFSFLSLSNMHYNNPHVNIGQVSQCVKSVNKFLEKNHATMYCYDGENEQISFNGCDKLVPSCDEMSPEKSIVSIYGELVNVGGSESVNIHIKPSFQNKMIKLDITRDFARKLAPNLYSFIGVTAEVEAINGEIIKGHVLNIIDYSPKTLTAWLQDEPMSQLCKKYSGINTEDLLNNLRGGTDSNE